MTEHNHGVVHDDEFDARLSHYLEWEIGQVRGAASNEEIAMRIAAGAGWRRWSANPVLVWAALLMTLLVVAATIFVAGNQDNKVVVVASPGPSIQVTPVASNSPTAAPTRAPITGAGPCRDGRIDIEPMVTVTWRPDNREIAAPSTGRLAMALEESSAGGSIVVTDPTHEGLRVVATFTGEEAGGADRVQVVGWSPDGSSLLVYALNWSNSDAARNCGNYFVVQADGSKVQRLTDYGPDELANGGNFSPSGASVAYTLGNELHVAAVSGGSRLLGAACPAVNGELRWTSDERQILLHCADYGVMLFDVASGQPRWLHLDPGPLDARWTTDEQGIVVAVGDEPPGLVGGPLSIVDVELAELRFATRVRSDVSTEWVLGVPSLSPDNRWLLVQGGGNVPDIPYYPTYLVDTATGLTTELPWPVMAEGPFDPWGRQPRITWLPGNDRILTLQQGKLYEVDLRAITRTAVGKVPAEDYAFSVSP
jgi:hypothetical protein